MIGNQFTSTALPEDWQPNYDRAPVVTVPGETDACDLGWDAITMRLSQAMPHAEQAVLSVDCYDGVDVAAVADVLTRGIAPDEVIDTRDLFKPVAEIDAGALDDQGELGRLGPIRIDPAGSRELGEPALEPIRQ